jgi:hypothetical protein
MLALGRSRAEITSDPFVQSLGREIGPVWPHDRAKLHVELHLCEEVRIPKGLEDATPWPSRQVELTLRAVLETQAQTVVAEHLDGSHVDQRAHSLILRQGRNTLQRLALSRQPPIGFEFFTMELRPLPNEP